MKAAAERRQQEERAQQLAKTLGAPVDVDPKEAILQEIRWSAGHVAFYRAQVQALDPEGLVRGIRKVETTERVGFQAGSATTKEAGPDVHVWLTLYDRERDRYTALCLAAIKVGIDERRIRIEEQQAALFAQGLTWLQSEARLRLDLNEAESRVFSELLSDMLRRLDELEAATTRV